MSKKIICMLLSAAVIALSACGAADTSDGGEAVDHIPGITAEKASELHSLTAASTANYSVNGAVAAYFFNSHYDAFISMEAASLKNAGFDENKPLGSQYIREQNLRDYFLDSTRTYLSYYMAMYESAARNGVSLTDDEIAALSERAERGISGIYGENLNREDILEALKLEALAAKLESEKKAELMPGEADMTSYVQSNKTDYSYSSEKTVNVRHILFSVDTYGSKEAALNKAMDVMAEVNLYDAEAFRLAAVRYSDDTSTCYTGGLYADLLKGATTGEFDKWSFDSSRKAGDLAVIETDFGAHIIYFEGEGLIEWQAEISAEIIDESFDAILTLLYRTYPVTFNEDTLLKIAE